MSDEFEYQKGDSASIASIKRHARVRRTDERVLVECRRLLRQQHRSEIVQRWKRLDRHRRESVISLLRDNASLVVREDAHRLAAELLEAFENAPKE